jgi:hypothetical protein
MMSEYFHIEYSKEHADTIKLVDIIKKDGWINSNTVIVNCPPDYSSRLVQVVNHKLSYMNRNELFEVVPLEMPYPNMSQIYDPNTHKYEMFDRYLTEWIRNHVDKRTQYLFLSSATLRGKNFSKVKLLMRGRVENENFRFASLYLQSSSILRPDYFVEEFDKEKKGGLLFEWENMDNPNWNY